ncbi:TetR family transcriptional regulator [Streptomyces sp. NPDC006640]|uniref:TetR family transcriptional regulator n=1 Tax=unclassified Streptomyces TaxID=2593676 RepID=UPI003681A7FE
MTRQERAVRTREALIEAAADLFDRDGQEVTSLAAVTAKAQVSAGALYFHFATKADLADAVTRTALSRLRQITGAPATTPADTNGHATGNGNGSGSGSGSGNENENEGGDGSRNGGGNENEGGDGSRNGGGSGWGGDARTQAARGVRGDRAAAPPARGPAPAAGGARGDRVGEVQQLIDTTHVLVRGLADDVVLRAGFALDRAGGQRPARERPVGEGPAGRVAGKGGTGGERPGRWPEVGGSLRGVWSGWVHETLAAAGTRGALAPGVSPGDAAAVVVAATVGFEVLGAQDPLWLAPHRLTRFWTLLLPALVPPPAREALHPEGSPAAH